MLENTAKQILNGEIGRNVVGIEPKFLVLGDEGTEYVCMFRTLLIILHGYISHQSLHRLITLLILNSYPKGIIAASFLFTEYAASTTSPPSLYGATSSASTSTFPSYFPPSSPPIPSFNDEARRRHTEPSPPGSLDPTRLAALTFVVPVLFMSGFAPYFEVMVDRVPGLVEKLRRLKKRGGMVSGDRFWRDVGNRDTAKRGIERSCCGWSQFGVHLYPPHA